MSKKVAIIGLGNVGVSYAFSLLQQPNLVDNIVLIDTNSNKLEAEQLDLSHGSIFASSPISIQMGTYSDLRRCRYCLYYCRSWSEFYKKISYG